MPKETYQFLVTMQYQQSVWVDAESLDEAERIMIVSTRPTEDDAEHSLYDAEVAYQYNMDVPEGEVPMPVAIHHFDGDKVADVEVGYSWC